MKILDCSLDYEYKKELEKENAIINNYKAMLNEYKLLTFYSDYLFNYLNDYKSLSNLQDKWSNITSEVWNKWLEEREDTR